MRIAKLSIKDLASRRTRAVLTVAAVALAVSLVVAMTGGLAALKQASYRLMTRYFGATDVVVSGEASGSFPEAIAERLRDEPGVRHAFERRSFYATPVGPDGAPRDQRTVRVVGVSGGELRLGRVGPVEQGKWFAGEAAAAVVEQRVAERYALAVGSVLRLSGEAGERTFEVVGITAKPSVIQVRKSTVYLPLETAQKLAGETDRITEVRVELERGVDPSAFVERARRRLGADVALKTKERQRRIIDRNLELVELLTYLGGTVAMLAGLFIVFSTLSMGVAERQRTLGMLRALGAYRGQVAAMVLGQAAILGGVGVGLGVLLGWGWVETLAAAYPDLFVAGAVVSARGALFGGVGMFVCSLLAAALPAWSAGRTDPLAAMAPLGRPPSTRVPLFAAAGGLLLIAVDPALVFSPGLGKATRMALHFAVGLPSLVVGLFLVAPLLVTGLERALARPLAAVLRCNPALLRRQVSNGPWRAAGTAAALMVGLATLVVLQVRGRTALTGWELPKRFPDVLAYAPFGLSPDEAGRLGRIEGVERGEVLPVAKVRPELGSSFFQLGGLVASPEATVFFGVDPEKAFAAAGDDGGMVELEFVEGSIESAVRRLKRGRFVVVSEAFKEAEGLGVGDTIAFQREDGDKVTYEIAGVYRPVGVASLARLFQIRTEFQKWTAGSVVGSLENARRDFGVESIQIFAMNTEAGVSVETLRKRIQKAFAPGMLLVADARKLKRQLDASMRHLVNLLSTVAYAALAIAALGVANTLMANIRSRQWQLGILRSVGLTRWGLVRLTFAEAVVLAGAACVLGLAGGTIMTVDAAELAKDLVGYAAPTEIPFVPIAVGVAATVGVAVIASLGPAAHVARRDTLELLQAGRGAA